MQRRKLGKWAKWACAVAAVLALGVAVVSRFFRLGYTTTRNSGGQQWIIAFESGQVMLVRWDPWVSKNAAMPSGWHGRWSPHWYWGYPGEDSPYWGTLPWRVGILYTPLGSGWAVGASVLYPVVLTLVPAAILWYADRRRCGPDACKKCRYDRAGLAATTNCPECGTIPAAR